MKHWLTIADAYHPIQFDTSLVPSMSCLRFVESKLIALARLYGLSVPTTREAQIAQRDLTLQVRRDLSCCARLVKRMHIAKPRYFMMQAYWAAIRGRRAPCRALIERCIVLCRDMQNLMELERANKNRDAWFSIRPTVAAGDETESDLWIKHSATLMPRWTELEDGKCKVNFLYNLPLFRAMN